MNITELKKKEKATIVSMQKVDKNFVKRLMDLGIYESAQVTLLNTMALNTLFLVEVDDIEICLRKEDAILIEVKQ